jgi:heme/copper-type cytochrome/quinol oxidase subunit 3
LALDAGLIFAIVVGAALFLILVTAIALAIGLYALDRGVRTARVSPAGPYVPEVEPEQRVAIPAAAPQPSPLTQAISRTGQIEVPAALGLGNTKLGMWAFLGSEVIFFTSLIAAFLLFRATGSIAPDDLEHFQEATSVFGFQLPLSAVLLVATNTFILLSSSFAVVMALDAAIEGKSGTARAFLIGVFVLGAIFVTIQGVEWSNLMGGGVTPDESIFGTAFFVLTGFHGTHVIVGLVWLLLFLLLPAFRGGPTPSDASSENLAFTGTLSISYGSCCSR